jgi:hypothetical protein
MLVFRPNASIAQTAYLENYDPLTKSGVVFSTNANIIHPGQTLRLEGGWRIASFGFIAGIDNKEYFRGTDDSPYIYSADVTARINPSTRTRYGATFECSVGGWMRRKQALLCNE